MTEFLRKLSKTDTRTIVTLFIIICTFLLMGMLFFVPIPKGNEALLNTLLPMLITSMPFVCINYYFGSSKVDKAEKIEKP